MYSGAKFSKNTALFLEGGRVTGNQQGVVQNLCSATEGPYQPKLEKARVQNQMPPGGKALAVLEGGLGEVWPSVERHN